MIICCVASGELVDARGKVDASLARESQAANEIEMLNGELKRSQELVNKLESDLENASYNSGGKVAVVQQHVSPGSSSGKSISAPDANLVALLSSGEDVSRNRSFVTRKADGDNAAGEGQMLAILTSQRDRYKERLDSMEGTM